MSQITELPLSQTAKKQDYQCDRGNLKYKLLFMRLCKPKKRKCCSNFLKNKYESTESRVAKNNEKERGPIMKNNTKNTGQPKFSIDLSQDKYESRYDRILNILFYAKEIPSDLYKHINMSHDNFRKAISILKQRDILTRISRDGAIGYILTANGRKLTYWVKYMKYRDCIGDERRQYDIKRRSRKRQFAYLYALFDRMGIPYESYNKPDIVEAFDHNKVYFYTALEYKRMLGIRSTAFKGSRVLGFFVGKGRIIPVYRTNHHMKTFSKEEALLPLFLQQFFSIPVSEAILICNDERSVINITKQIISNTGNDEKKGVNTAKHKRFYIFDSGDNFYSRFEDLYTDYSELMQRLIEQNNIETTDRDKEGNYRLLIGTGFYRDNPVWICPGNIDAVTLRLFVINANRNGKINFIVCQERDVDTLKKIVENSSLSVWPIREG